MDNEFLVFLLFFIFINLISILCSTFFVKRRGLNEKKVWVTFATITGVIAGGTLGIWLSWFNPNPNSDMTLLEKFLSTIIMIVLFALMFSGSMLGFFRQRKLFKPIRKTILSTFIKRKK
ncbi:hypothetical protein [Halobacillus sp. Nhm2S1]|uniref:hypothetical protein n=1 Tax=Halobacillus sp. Nhm2S1 TaxID=2866716 RepID=UPI001C72FFA3|nr:hypothetical protein [Halobacillus sp. Nhm2S1]MBX0358465.1 hypothetical protein [Halobacillus sp. Nhm2S1]